jgi:endo-1,4-beta-xylanase
VASCFAAPTLKEAYQGRFVIGAAITREQVLGKRPELDALLREHFNSITPENLLKWSNLQPRPGVFTFEAADAYVSYGERLGMNIIGHTLVWHEQTPAWVFQDEQGMRLGREALLARLRTHIQTVVGRFRGRIHGWDVVNEAVAGNGELRRSPWLEIIGEDYLAKAFEYAREADPKAELYYNDYGVEYPAKRRGAVALLKRLQQRGVRVDGVGIQGHYRLSEPSLEQVDATIRELAGLGLKVMITELDVNLLPTPGKEAGADVNLRFAADPKWDPYAAGLPAAEQAKLAARYAGLFEVFLRNDAFIERVTFWGLHDGGTWLNGWPIKGRTNHPLLFDRAYRPKPALEAVLAVPGKHKGWTPGPYENPDPLR